jgi:hypothetical protein
MRRVRAWAAWFVALFWGWLLLAGEWNRQQWVAAAAAAAAGATFGELVRARMGFAARLPLSALADVPSVLLAIVVDFGLLVRALAVSAWRREVVRGVFRSHELETGGDDARGVGLRAWTEIAATYSPNSYVVEIEPERGLVLLHDLVPRRSSETPA